MREAGDGKVHVGDAHGRLFCLIRNVKKSSSCRNRISDEMSSFEERERIQSDRKLDIGRKDEMKEVAPDGKGKLR